MIRARKFLRTIHGFKIPDIGEGISEVQLMEWFVKQGDAIREMDKLCLVESDKAAVEITSKFTGKITKLHFNQFDTIKIGSVLVDIDDGQSTSPVEPSPAAPPPPPPTGNQKPQPSPPKQQHHQPEGGGVQATPAVRQLAKKLNVDLNSVKGTGKNGRVTEEDVTAASTRPTQTEEGGSEKIELRGVKAAMARSMTASASVPHLTIGEEVRMDAMLDAIQTVKEIAKTRHNLPSLTLTSFLIKALSMTLNAHPELNSKCHVEGEKFFIEVISDHNVSVAIQTENGLMVPNIKRVQDLSVPEIQRDLLRLIDKAKTNRLLPEDIKGGTISLSNIGVIGGTYAQPVLFDGQAVIGVVGRVRSLPRFSEGSLIEAHRIANFSWSADHRIVDGASMALFSRTFKELVETPDRWLLDLK